MLSLTDVHKTFRPSQSLGKELAGFFKGLKFAKKNSNLVEMDGGIRAVRGVTLEVKPGEILGVLGESGSGKSTLGRLMAGLYAPTFGHVSAAGRNLATFNRDDWKSFRRQVQIMFQDPVSSLNPRLTAGATLEEGLIIHALGTPRERRERVEQLLGEVGLPLEARGRYGHEFSGGQRQRLSLARALVLNPEVVIADEPVSALDVSIQAQIINLLSDLRASRGLTLVLISHDLPLMRVMADRLVLMYGGLLMEVVDKSLLTKVPHHPYLRSLWASAEGGEGMILAGEPPDPQNPPLGCPFHPRCPEAIADCRHEQPLLRELLPGFACACFLR